MAGKKKNSRKALPHDPFEDMGKLDWLEPAAEDATQADAVGTAARSTGGGNSGAETVAENPKPKSGTKETTAAKRAKKEGAESAEDVEVLVRPETEESVGRPEKESPRAKKKAAAKRAAKPEQSSEALEVAAEAISEVTEVVTSSTQDESADVVQTKELKDSGADGEKSRSKKRKPRTKKRGPESGAEEPTERPTSTEAVKATTPEIAESGTASIEPSTEAIDPYLENLIAKIDGEMEAAFGRDPIVEVAPEEAGDTVAEQHIIFELAGTEYAVYITNVIEIGHPLHVTPVPNVPAWVQGVVNLRGDVVSIVDLRAFLGMEAASYRQSSRMLVARTHQEDLTVGLIVDRVSGIRFLDIGRFGAPTADIEDQIAPYLRGTYEHEGHLLVVLDLDRLLRSTEMRQFEPV